MLLFILCGAVPFYLLAQQDTVGKKKLVEISTDLPDETEETDLIEKGSWQLETAVLLNRYKQGANSVIGQAMLRYGILDWLEVRLLIEDGRQRDKYMEETVQSTYPMAASAKIAILKDVKGLPDITIVSYLKLPFTSHSSEQKAYWSPIVLAAFQNKFSHDKFKLEYNVGGQQEAYSADWVAFTNASLHYKLTEQLEVFTEYYAQFQSGEAPQHNIGGGVSFQLNNMLEFYVYKGSTVYYESTNDFYNGGVAIHIP